MKYDPKKDLEEFENQQKLDPDLAAFQQQEMQNSPPTKEQIPVGDFLDLQNPYLRTAAHEYTPTLEQVYDAAGNAIAPVGRALDIGTTWGTESLRHAVRAIAPSDTQYQQAPPDTLAAFRQSGNSGRVGTYPLLNDIQNAVGVRAEPLATIQSKSFPKAAQFAEELTNPTRSGSMVLDALAGSRLPSPTPESIDYNLKQGGIAAQDYLSGAKRLLTGEKSPEVDIVRPVDPRTGMPLMPSVVGTTRKPTPMGYNYNMALNYLTAKNPRMVEKLKESGSLTGVVDYAARHPEEYIFPRPDKALENIEGPLVTTDELGVKRGRIDRSSGKIANLTEQQNQAIEEMPRDTYDVNRIDFVNRAKGKIPSGVDPIQTPTIKNYIDQAVDPMYADPAKLDKIKQAEQVGAQIGDLNSEIDYVTKRHAETAQFNHNKTIQSEQSSIQDKISAEKSRLNPSGVEKPDYNAMKRKIEEKVSLLNEQINALNNREIPLGKDFNRMAKLRQERAALLKQHAELYDPSVPTAGDYTKLIYDRNNEPAGFASKMRRQGNKMQQTIGNEPLHEQGAYHLAGKALEDAGREAQNIIMESAPGHDIDMFNARNSEISKNMSLQEILSKKRLQQGPDVNVPQIGNVKASVVRQGVDNYSQYVAPKLTEANMSLMKHGAAMGKIVTKPLPIMLASFSIPRNSSEILNNKDVVLAKVAQEAKTPQQHMQFMMLKDALENHPEKLKDALPALVLAFPNLFQQDKYGRVDGRILDPMLLQKAQNDLKLDSTMSAPDKALKMDDLINKHELHDN